jgi:hypothetical protein
MIRYSHQRGYALIPLTNSKEILGKLSFTVIYITKIRKKASYPV